MLNLPKSLTSYNSIKYLISRISEYVPRILKRAFKYIVIIALLYVIESNISKLYAPNRGNQLSRYTGFQLPSALTADLSVLNKLLYIQYHLPQYLCPYEERIGGFDDGGKWSCQLRTLLPSVDHCVIYSFGSRLEFDFENHFADIADCETHIFDPTPSLQQKAKGITFPKNTYFHSYGLGGEDQFVLIEGVRVDVKSLDQIVTELGHSYIDVLKIDIEGNEWDLLPTDEDSIWSKHKIGQLYIEVHEADLDNRITSLMRSLSACGFLVFHSEVNPFYYFTWEFSFIDPQYRRSESGPTQAVRMLKGYPKELIQKVHDLDIANRNKFWQATTKDVGHYFRKPGFYFNNAESTYHCVNRILLANPNKQIALRMNLCMDTLLNHEDFTYLAIYEDSKADPVTEMEKPPARSAVEAPLRKSFPSAKFSLYGVNSASQDFWLTIKGLGKADIIKFDVMSDIPIIQYEEFISFIDLSGAQVVQLEVHMDSNKESTNFGSLMAWLKALDKSPFEIYEKEQVFSDVVFSSSNVLHWSEATHASLSLIRTQK